jgi:redox-sensitive bicupin YhaK (pirin superfamily)
MISHTAINARDFVYCLTYQSPHETAIYFNDNTGHYHSSIYLIEGTMDVNVDGEDLAPLQHGILYDISHTKGKTITTKTGSSGASMVMFNPLPEDRALHVEIVSENKTVAAETRTTIVCLTGPIAVNDKQLNTNQYAVVLPGKSATLEMGNNTLCAIVTQ